MMRPLRGHGLRRAVVLAAALATAAAPAVADPIAGASYTGVAADGAAVTFTISPDGTLVNSYRVSGARGDTCVFTGEGDEAIWEGAPIVSNSFQYRLYDSILFRGTFPGPQSAAGTFRFYNRATSASPACDTGTVSWTATTTATPPPTSSTGPYSPPPPGTPTPGQPSTGTAGNKKPTFATRVALRKLSRTRIGGRVSSANKACRGGRTVYLWLGSRRIAKTRTKSDGSYKFVRSAKIRGKRVRAAASTRSSATVVCAAGSSIRIRV
jgi:hypothetical protein